ncbi:somatostatin receptor type 5-like [Malaya genurostris]|uniref:somatostatin receptor type 5-like n=1 Tax=Malaya genurostris TaxID=325434 RepID=UPI0026F3B4AB|nr:somatostatin receptor type 5-like [Malaya genurostris]
MDVSIYDYPREIWIIKPFGEIFLKVVTFIPVLTFGVFGNVALLCIISTIRTLRTPTNILIANLAVADLATVLVCPIMFMSHDFYQNYSMGPIGCKLEGFLEGSFLITSVLCLCTISYDRLTAIVLLRKSRLTIRGVSVLIFGTWLSGTLLALPLAVFRNYKERQWNDFLESFCAEDTNFLPQYWHVMISALVWFPLLVMVGCYSLIFLKLNLYERNVQSRKHTISLRYKKKVVKSLFVVLLIFILFRIPFTTLVFIRYRRFLNETTDELGEDFKILWYTSHYLMFLNAAINPLIYGLTNDNFRRAYNKTSVWRCFWGSLYSNKAKPQKQSTVVSISKLQPRDPCASDHIVTHSCRMAQTKNNRLIAASGETRSSQLNPITEKTMKGPSFETNLINSNQFHYKHGPLQSSEYI